MPEKQVENVFMFYICLHIILNFFSKFNISSAPLNITIRVIQNAPSLISVKTSCGGVQDKKDVMADSNNPIPISMGTPLSWSSADQSLALQGVQLQTLLCKGLDSKGSEGMQSSPFW